MKKKSTISLFRFKLILFLGLLFLGSDIMAQCGAGTSYGSLTITNAWQNTGSLGVNERPYWSFNATTGLIYSFTNCNGIGEDTYLRIYDASWTQVTYNDDYGPYCSSTNASLDWTCSTSGTYYVMLTHYSCNVLSTNQVLTYKDNSTGGDHCYTCPTYDFGPFTPSATVATHSSGVATNTGCRLYAFNVTSGIQYTFSTCSNGGTFTGDPAMTLYNNSCTQLAYTDDYCGLGPEISWTATYTGVVYLRLAHYATNGIVTWNLAYWRAALPGDNCSNPQNLASLTSPYSATTVGYADDISVCRTGYPDRIFYLDVPNGYILDIWESTNAYDEWEYLGYGAACPGTTTIQCWDNDALAHIIWTNSTGSTQTVWYVQDAYSGSGTFTLNWTLTSPGTPPLCTTPTTPANGATNVLATATLNWNSSTGATGYKLYFGTDNPPTNIVNGTNLGNVLTYDPTPDMSYLTTYYWRVVPTNSYGDATGCSTWSFTTEPTPRPCASCTPEDVNLGTIGTVVYGYNVSGNCGYGGKWVGSFTGETGATYHFDLCPDAPGAGLNSGFDPDIKITDASCTILAGEDGNCSSPSWSPNDFQWTCSTAGTYYVIIAPYSSYNSHSCYGTAANTFTLNYYKSLGGFWTGAVSTDWGTTGNWADGQIPANTVDVTIPAACPNYPVLNSVLPVCNNITIQNGGSLTLSSGSSLAVGGIFSNSGTVNNNGGSLYITGDYYSETTGVFNQNWGSWEMNMFSSSGFWADGAVVLSGGTITNYGAVVAAFTSFTMNGAFDWYIEGDAARWDGAYFTSSPTGGTVHLTGSAANIYVYGPSAGTNMLFYNLDINPATGSFVYLNPTWGATDITIFNNLYVRSGNVTTDNTGVLSNVVSVLGSAAIYENASMTMNTTTSGNINGDLTIVSTAAGTGSWIDNGNTIVGGASMVDRYVTPNQWHYVSSPLSNSLTGVFYGSYLKEWYESTYTWSPYIVPTTNPLNVAQGYELWKSGSPKVFHYLGGSINTGNIAAPLTATDRNGNLSIAWGDYEGWNFIGNPYPSALDWNGSWTTANIDPTVYIYDGSINQYAEWNWFTGLGVNKTDGTIPANQGFFVHANNFAPALTIPQAERFHSNQSFYKSSDPGTISDHRVALYVNGPKIPAVTDAIPEEKASAAGYEMIRLTVGSGSLKDETLLFFTEHATDNFDSKYDAYKLDGATTSPSIYTRIGDVKIAMNGMNRYSGESIIPLYFTPGTAGTFEITPSLSGGFDFTAVYLEDLLTGNITNLKQTGSYTFSSDPGDSPARFIIYFGDEVSPGPAHDKIAAGIFAWGNTVYISQPESVQSQVFIYDMLGQLLYSGQFEPSTLIRVNGISAKGYVTVKLVNDKIIKTEKVFIQ